MTWYRDLINGVYTAFVDVSLPEFVAETADPGTIALEGMVGRIMVCSRRQTGRILPYCYGNPK